MVCQLVELLFLELEFPRELEFPLEREREWEPEVALDHLPLVEEEEAVDWAALQKT
jgi:hypothetical protein